MDSASDDATEDHVRRTIASILAVELSELEDDVLIREELGVDSLRALEIIAACERTLSIEIDEQECAAFETVGQFVSHVARVWQSSKEMK